MLSKLERSSVKVALDPVSTKTKHSSTPNCWHPGLPIDTSGTWTKRILVASTPSEEICFQAAFAAPSHHSPQREQEHVGHQMLLQPPEVLSQFQSQRKGQGGKNKQMILIWWFGNRTGKRSPYQRFKLKWTKQKRALCIIPKYVHTLTYLRLEELVLGRSHLKPQSAVGYSFLE